jgi:DNA helicase-2/ATP-dependent DNA helicase PcrA
MLKASELGLGSRITASIEEFGKLLNELDALSATEGPADVLKQALIRSGYRTELEISRDPQDEARLENLDALLGQLYDWQREFPSGTVADYLAEVTLATDQDQIDDESGNLSLMTLHTAKGLEFDSVFIIGCEQGTLPHIRAFDEPGGLQEERRLMYVGMTRAKKKLTLSHALQRTVFGNTSSFLPSSFLSDIPSDLQAAISQVRESIPTPIRKWQGLVTASTIRDNQDLQLSAGERVKHETFGEGQVLAVSGQGPRQVAEVRFESGVTKRLLTKMAPIIRL